MNRYAKIYGSIWTDEKFSLLKEESKLLYFYLISCKSCNSVGLFKLGKGTITDEFCTDIEGNEVVTPQELDDILDDLNQSGLVQYKNRWVMFNQWMRWNQPSSPVHVPGLSTEINDLISQKPPKDFLARLLNRMKSCLEGLTVKNDKAKRTYYAILKDTLNLKALSDYFGGEDRLAEAFNGNYKETAEKPTPRLPNDYLKTKYRLGNQNVRSKEEEKEEGEEEVEGKGEETPFPFLKEGESAEITLFCADGQTGVVSPSAVLKAIKDHPRMNFQKVKSKIQFRSLVDRPYVENVDQFFLDAVKEVCNV